jgi:uncharacterized SAM-binding protein YcdF (DUF218 family)
MNSISQLSDLSRPVPQAALLIGIGLVFLCFRHYRTGAITCALGIAWVVLCATPSFVRLLQHGLESGYSRIDAAQYPTADAIVVLGGGDPLRLSHPGNTTLQDLSMTRPGFGLALFRHERAPILLLSGGGSGEAVEMAGQLAKFGVPRSAMRVEYKSLTTHENALYSAAILKPEGRQRILLVTSAWAMPRAAASFRRQGLDVIPAPSFDRSTTSPTNVGWLPRRALLWQSGRFLHEYLGLLFYKLRGWA